MKAITKLLRSLVLPLLIVIAGIFLYLKLTELPTSVTLLMYYLPYGILLIGMLLSLRFNRSRIFFILVVLLASLLTIVYAPKILMIYDDLTIFYLVLGVIIPINLAIFSLLKERGFFTVWGVLRFIFISLQLAFIVGSVGASNYTNLEFLYKDYINLPFNTNSPQLVIFSITLSVVGLLVKGYINSAYSDGPLIASLIAITIALSIKTTTGVLVLFSAIGIVLIISIIQDSYRMSYLDELTGLPGRRALKEDMLKLSGTYSVAMLDIDFFKKFNDKHGHDVGDEVLKMVANCLSKVTGGGKAFRYGGEEFTVLFPGKSADETLSHLEELRETVAKRAFILRSPNRPKTKPKTKSQTTRKSPSTVGRKLFVTISIGVANRTKETKSPQEVMKNADKALYKAKKKGRNCVCR
ncbi:GGDEF domain-containing protein [Alkaliphilus transvaalensis]|uniref:GGDEF domain-containing protein n=1 Tax=Alkaliphilus transvaalensis TaxID=114628 RepID=UPI00047BACFD|nr:GGDEF domain-containing protein [Alkaliphilus transvaalensis]